MELIAFFTVGIISFLILRKFIERRNKPLGFLFTSALLTSLTVGVLAIGKLADFLSGVPRETFSATDFTSVLAYIILTFVNISVLGFYVAVFSKDTFYRTLTIFSILNGITIGLLIRHLSFQYLIVETLALKILYHVVISVTTFSFVFRASMKASKVANDNVGKRGMELIALYAFGTILSYVFFFLDILVVSTSNALFSPFYFIAWGTVAFAAFCAYLGFIMPEWYKLRIS